MKSFKFIYPVYRLFQLHGYGAVAGQSLEGLAVVAPCDFGIVPAVVGIEIQTIAIRLVKAAGYGGIPRHDAKASCRMGALQGIGIDIYFFNDKISTSKTYWLRSCFTAVEVDESVA